MCVTMLVQTTDTSGQALDGLDAFFAEVLGEPSQELGEAPSIQDIPAIGDGGLLAAFEE
ncbi:hypothetical protein [Rhodococcus globerulus]|uniref:hypothetical protein n=1 Tax=Rhodococcus globerulus TaxID=33008 RepID=UPI001586375A|nr:hypothetical protein [Rhodococcus globerulus]